MAKYVAYYRARSGPGRDEAAAVQAQRESVRAYVVGRGELVDEFIESDGQHHLEHALKAARRARAELLIPRFKALSRDPAFMGRINEGKIAIIALDLPHLDKKAVQALTAAADDRRSAHSIRVRASLQAAKARGVRLGNPRILDIQKTGVDAAKRAAAKSRQALHLEILQLRDKGLSLRQIAEELNRQNIPTVRGRSWHASSVRNILQEIRS